MEKDSEKQSRAFSNENISTVGDVSSTTENSCEKTESQSVHLESSNDDKSNMSDNHESNSSGKYETSSEDASLNTDLNSQQKSSFGKFGEISGTTEIKGRNAETLNIESSDESSSKSDEQESTEIGIDCIKKKGANAEDIDSSQQKYTDEKPKTCDKMELDFEVESNGSGDLNVSSSVDLHLKTGPNSKTKSRNGMQIRGAGVASDITFVVPSKNITENKIDDEMDVDICPNDTVKFKASLKNDENPMQKRKRKLSVDFKIQGSRNVDLPSQKGKCNTDAEENFELSQKAKEPFENEVSDNGELNDVDSPSKEPDDGAQDGDDANPIDNARDKDNDSKVSQKEKSRGIDAIAKKLGLQMKISETNAESTNKADSTENKKMKENAAASEVESTSKVNEGEATDLTLKAEPKEKENEARASTHPKHEAERTKPKKVPRTCVECGVSKGLKFQVLFQGKTRYLCSDTCFKSFKNQQKLSKSPNDTPGTSAAALPPKQEDCSFCKKEISDSVGFYPTVGETKPLCSQDCLGSYHDSNIPKKKCSQCKKLIDGGHNCLSWETMEFCNEDCLGKYQSFLGSHCTCCQSPVHQTSLGKYCVCFGADIRQFCSGSCLEEFKKGLKVCSFCQKDLSSGVEGFLAPVGDRGQFKDFCTQMCMERYESMNCRTAMPPQPEPCNICKTTGIFKIQVKHDEKTTGLCSDNCVAGFRYVNKINSKMCETCFQFFEPDANSELFLHFEGAHKWYCTKACMTLFVLSHRKIIPCAWCKVKKYNFDMIEKVDASKLVQMYCSLNCLSLYRVSLNATSSRSIRCDNCNKNLPAQYHLTMSDGSIRNFCSYQCVIQFQNQFTNVPTLTTVTPGNRQNSSGQQPSVTKSTGVNSTPVISNVMSLATSAPRSSTPTVAAKLLPQKLLTIRQPPPLAVNTKALTSSSNVTTSTPANANSSGSQIVREVIVKPPAPKSVRNKTVLCKPIMQTKGISCKPHPCHKAVQTEESPRPIIIPIPVPVYVPVPVHMFSRPVPCPVPFPIPIPVPIFVPTTKDSPTQIIKHLKDIQEKIPANPFEAELLMMAEMVAEDDDKKGEGQAAEEVACVTTVVDDINIPNTEPKSPDIPLDVETAMPSGISPAMPKDQEALSDQDEEFYVKDEQSQGRGKRSAGTRGRGRGRKRPKLDEAIPEDPDSVVVLPVIDEEPPSQPSDPPDTSPRLKHTFGVNAWKYWVLQKNAHLEKSPQSSRKFKLFKTDVLQLPPDELNYSLSLFVKEVRKPTGEEYAPASVYYLSLGLQQHLFLNGRIDNLFTDPYYEQFTDCLNDIFIGQEELVNVEGFLASKVEEEILWESKQLGAHSPQVLLNTLMYFNTKHFNLRTAEDHYHLSFSHITKHWRKTPVKGGPRNVLLRYFPPLNKDWQRRRKDDNAMYEQSENTVNPLRCPVKLYEFYLSKCPESVKTRNDVFYLQPERSCVPDSPVWYSTQALGQDIIVKMLRRIKIVQEISEA